MKINHCEKRSAPIEPLPNSLCYFLRSCYWKALPCCSLMMPSYCCGWRWVQENAKGKNERERGQSAIVDLTLLMCLRSSSEIMRLWFDTTQCACSLVFLWTNTQFDLYSVLDFRLKSMCMLTRDNMYEEVHVLLHTKKIASHFFLSLPCARTSVFSSTYRSIKKRLHF